MTDAPDNPRAVVGHNNPPPPTPWEAAQERIDDLYTEAQGFLDGAPVDNKGLADAVSNLQRLLQTARGAADDARRVENEPFDTGKAEVQARYNPLLKKADNAIEACKKAQEPWLKKQKAELEAAAAEARRVAQEKARLAQEAIRAVDRSNLMARAAAEDLLRDAKVAAIAATKAEKTTAKTGGAFGRAVGLRSVWIATMTNRRAALKHYCQIRPDQVTEFLQTMADNDVRAGQRSIPGFGIAEDQHAV